MADLGIVMAIGNCDIFQVQITIFDIDLHFENYPFYGNLASVWLSFEKRSKWKTSPGEQEIAKGLG